MANAGSLLAQVLHLPIEERASLVRQVAESLDPRFETGATEAWSLEIGVEDLKAKLAAGIGVSRNAGDGVREARSRSFGDF